jgi:hypothetical protein
MKERPIPFTASMVRALLDGSKTQTRRALRTQPFADDTYHDGNIGLVGYPLRSTSEPVIAEFSVGAIGGGGKRASARCPYGAPGDRLWVRETHRPIFGQTCGLIAVDYQADPREKWERLGDQIGTPPKWVQARYMRREYSRILLEIVGVRVERLQEISEADAKAEGVTPDEVRQMWLFGASAEQRAAIYRRAAVNPYQELWEQINGTGSWDANPWVWVVEFKRVQP